MPQTSSLTIAGSSPLARGAHHAGHEGAHDRGIIPACAGSTCLHRLGLLFSWDHPRLRGEHDRDAAVAVRAEGSSPLARGALLAHDHPHRAVRIIPACAGSTDGQYLRLPHGRDHPRLRGEHKSPETRSSGSKGSSPLARGARPCIRALWSMGRIIPACAGSTVQLGRLEAYPRDHPRLRGEHLPSRSWTASPPGSSPLARGAHAPRAHAARHHGIIPACAGSTPSRASRARA